MATSESGEVSRSEVETTPRLQAEDIRRILEETKAQGLSLAEYARCHGLKVERLYRLIERLKKKGVHLPKANSTGPKTRPAFLPAVVVERPARSAEGLTAGDTGVEVRLRTGHLVRVSASFDVSTFQRVVSALEGDAC
jgi:hypothetical protein